MADLICDVAIIGDGTPARRVRRWTCTKALIKDSKLPKAAQEVAILVTGALFNSRYELYDAYDISMPEREEKLPSG